MGEIGPEAIADAWNRWWRTSDLSARNFLVEHYMGEVKRIARQFPNVRAHDREDLHGYGYLGLIKAVQDWDPAKMPWGRFMGHKVRYAMIDGIRAATWVPKGIREEAGVIEAAEELLHNKHGRAATINELAEHLGLTVEQLEARVASVRSTDWNVASLDYTGETETPWHDAIRDPNAEDPSRAAVRREEIDSLELILQRLSGREREVIRWAYFHWPRIEQREIAKRLCVHESRVSQILKGALERAKKLVHQPALFVEEIYASSPRMTRRD